MFQKKKQLQWKKYDIFALFSTMELFLFIKKGYLIQEGSKNGSSPGALCALLFMKHVKGRIVFFRAPRRSQMYVDQLQLQSVWVFRCDPGTGRSQKEMDVKKVSPRYSWTKRLRRIIITMKT